MNQPLSLTRRRLVHTTAMAAASRVWGGWLLRAAAMPTTRQARARAVIMIFNGGGPSHLDLWDMKPNATREIRGEFSPISTRVPGLQVSELLPQLAQRADLLAIVRSLHHEHGQHNAGMHWATVGRPYRIDSTLINPSSTDLPGLGTLVGWLAQRDGQTRGLPPYVITPRPHCDSFRYITPGQFGGCLGARFDPFVLNADPNAKDFHVRDLRPIEAVPSARLQQRRELLGTLDRWSAAGLEHDLGVDQTASLERAFGLLSSPAAAEAFDLSREPAAVRDRYGRHPWGQSHLLARRLVEHGVKFVTTVNGPSITWDTHRDNFGQMKHRLVPPMDQAFAALLDDLQERGLLDSTIVFWNGDFGRTPKVNQDAGRDHWPQCYSAVLAGGGIQGGQFVGRSDSHGAAPLERPLTPADLHATIFSALGYDSQAIHYQSADGRPIPLSTGHSVAELLG